MRNSALAIKSLSTTITKNETKIKVNRNFKKIAQKITNS